jgi:hypothetical protein
MWPAGLSAELEALNEDARGPGRRDSAVQPSVDSLFAIGYPRGPRAAASDERPMLDRLPYLRRL